MVALGFVVLCLQAVFLNSAFSQPLPCNGNITPSSLSNLGASTAGINLLGNIGGFGNIGSCNNGNIANLGNIGPIGNNCNCGNIDTPLTITSATFTPLANGLANQVGLPGATISEVVPNLQFGDISLTGDLPIGGTIKVSGCFPVYGMVAVDGALPSTGSAVVSTGCQFPAQLVDNNCVCGNRMR